MKLFFNIYLLIAGLFINVFADIVPSSPPQVLPLNEAKVLLKEFQRAQKTEIKALEHQQKFELSELRASQKVRQREWEAQEREARHRFFSVHLQGVDRRAYIKSFLERRQALNQILADERAQRAHDFEVRKKALKDDQQAKMKEFQSLLSQGQKPPTRLWPQAGR